MRRAAQVQPEIEFALARQSEMAALQTALKAGELPLRVTHNDTKLNNVLLDAKTRKALCVIDLDTVMPGSSLYDFGDSIRFGAATAAEDERDLSRMEMSLERFRVFTRGYVRSCPGLTQKELELLPLGAKTMTMECGVRFLTTISTATTILPSTATARTSTVPARSSGWSRIWRKNGTKCRKSLLKKQIRRDKLCCT